MGVRVDVVSSFNVTAIGKKKLRPVTFRVCASFNLSLSYTSSCDAFCVNEYKSLRSKILQTYGKNYIFAIHSLIIIINSC